MKISLPLSLLAISFLLVASLFINRRDDKASGGKPGLGYMAFNNASTQRANAILHYWQEDGLHTRLKAVKAIAITGFFMIAVYFVYLFYAIRRTRMNMMKPAFKSWLNIALLLVIAGALLDTWMNARLLSVLSATHVHSLAWVSKMKWALLIATIFILIISMLPADAIKLNGRRRMVRYTSQLLGAIWLFFPGLIFILLPLACFWLLGQGQDIIVAFTRNNNGNLSFLHFNYTPIVFFLAIAFWVFISWYSSRVVGYTKKFRQKAQFKKMTGKTEEEAEEAFESHMDYFSIGRNFLYQFPHLLGNSCFLVIELAVLQSPVMPYPINGLEAAVFFFMGLAVLHYINVWIAQHRGVQVQMLRWFYELFYTFIFLLLAICFVVYTHTFKSAQIIVFLLVLLLIFHLVFVSYINIRAVKMINNAEKTEREIATRATPGFLVSVMEYLCIPLKEKGYFTTFQWVSIIAIFFYMLSIFWLDAARAIGPFAFMILAFGVLLGFVNMVTAFSVRYSINFHFILFGLALVFGLKETHSVRTMPAAGMDYSKRPTLKTYLSAWLKARHINELNGRYDVYLVMANGGASRSGYWTAAALGKIQDSSLNHPGGRFSDHVLCLSGTSGGGVGVATFYALLRDKQQLRPVYAASAKDFLSRDYFTYTIARMLGPDVLNYIVHIPFMDDRAGALETSFERTASAGPADEYSVGFNKPFGSFPAMRDTSINLPILFINTTRMQDGNPGIVTNLKPEAQIFNRRVDVLSLLDTGRDISLTTAAILGARFPYLSPAGGIANNYFVDGGYFDNSGAGVVQELIRGIMNLAKDDTTLAAQVRKLNFNVLHIINSPENTNAAFEDVAPIRNDLLSPILTIAGAYDMQTTVNDNRLHNYIDDILRDSINRTTYISISLYETPIEWSLDARNTQLRQEPSYAMNWFMSDSLLSRINNRLNSNPVLDSLAKAFAKEEGQK